MTYSWFKSYLADQKQGICPRFPSVFDIQKWSGQIIQVSFFFLTLTFNVGRATSAWSPTMVAQGFLEFSTYCGHIDFLWGTSVTTLSSTAWQHAKISTEILTCWICCNLTLLISDIHIGHIQYAKITCQCVTENYTIYSDLTVTLTKRFPNSYLKLKLKI